MAQPEFRKFQGKSTSNGKNPYQLTKNQHIHSKHAIGLFNNEHKKVEVFDLASGGITQKRAGDSFFCGMRLWDERAEKGYMAAIENKFHNEIDNLRPVTKRNHRAITEYFFLWKFRHMALSFKKENINLAGVSGDDLTHDEEEILEKKHTVFVQEDSSVPYHMYNGLHIQVSIDKAMYQFENLRWGLWKAKRGEFILADSYYKLDELCGFFPISPTLAFAASMQDGMINYDDVKLCNQQSKKFASSYCIARSWTNAPL